MHHAFESLRPHLDWLTAAFARGIEDTPSLESGRGWDKVYARVELCIAMERSIRRNANRPTHCIYGPRASCPDDLPYRCDCCVRMVRAKELVA